jgi:hypothetical protein
MLYKLGRLFQAIGLVLPLVAIAGNVAVPKQVDLKLSLIISATGIGIFVVGWLLQQATRPR